MVTRNVDSSQGNGGMASATRVVAADQARYRAGNTVFKSGSLFISSKGLGWTSWKKRWFILTRTSLVFFRSDPSALPQKGGEVNLTLGGIDLNNSGSVVVREDKKLLTVLFPDGRDGRAFTLKAETSEDMYEWKTALENALAQAPSAALVMGQNAIFRNDTTDIEGSLEQWRDRRPVTSLVVGRPILLALEDIDGGPSFLEKALRFIEQYGVKVEGILRQSADVEEVERRVQEYEQGKNEFSPDEDAHIVGDCVKHVLRELPSSPVPASCCTLLLEAYRTDCGARVNAMRAAISETFPEPNRRLLQRILKMMQTVASHKSVNRMTSSAVAACMAPLLLRPLLAGDCELEDEFNMGDDGSAQLLQAAAAANHAQAIVLSLLEEYDDIFLDELMPGGSFSSELYSESEDSGSGDEEATDVEILEDDGYHDAQNDLDQEDDRAQSGTLSESSGNGDGDPCENKIFEGHASDSEFLKANEGFGASQKQLNEVHTPLPRHDNVQSSDNLQSRSSNCPAMCSSESHEILGDVPASASSVPKSTGHSLSPCITKFTSQSNGPSMPTVRRPAIWGRTSARKNLSMESIDYSSEDEIAIQKLEITKNDLQNKIAKEAKGNSILQASLESRKQALHERRIALEQDVTRLQEQLQRERDLRETLDAGLNMPFGHLSISSNVDNKTRADLEEISLAEADVIKLKQKIADLHVQLNQHRQHDYNSFCESCSQHQHTANNLALRKDQHVETTTTENEGNLFGVGRETGGTHDSPSLSTRLPPQKTHRNLTNQNTVKSSSVSTEEPLKVASNASKKPAAKGEVHHGTGSTASALTKLTTRINFLKERRTQLVNELQTLETTGIQGSFVQIPGPPPKTNSR